MSELFDDLKKLGEMRDRGEITQDEYEIVKRELLDEMEGANKAEDHAEKRPPGWYNDPDGEYSHQAYWDGEKWTGDTRRSPDQAGAPAKTTSKLNLPTGGKGCLFWSVIGLIVIVVVGAIGMAIDPPPEDLDLNVTIYDASLSPSGYLDVFVGIANPHTTTVSDVSCFARAFDERGNAVTGYLDSFLYSDMELPSGGSTTVTLELGQPDGFVADIEVDCSGNAPE